MTQSTAPNAQHVTGWTASCNLYFQVSTAGRLQVNMHQSVTPLEAITMRIDLHATVLQC